MKLFIEVQDERFGGMRAINVLSISELCVVGKENEKTRIVYGPDANWIEVNEPYEQVCRKVRAATGFMFSGGAV